LARKRPTVNGVESRVVTISATLGGPSTFAIDSEERIVNVVSSSILILDTLLPALTTGAKSGKVELVPGTNVIKRVNPYAVGSRPSVRFAGDYTVSRMATQRKPNGSDEHLEVFVKMNQSEKAFNVYDPFLQHILIAAFGIQSSPDGALIDIELDGEEIAKVMLGQANPVGTE
jgi:hypothetical protein